MTSERFWGLVLGNLGVFDGVPAELQMVPDGRNGRNGRCYRWIPLALGLLLFTRSYCCSVVTVQRFNTVQRLTLRCSSGGAPSATRARSDEARGRQSPRPTATPTRHSHTTRHSAIRQSESPSASRAHTPQPAGAAPAAPRRARRPKAWDGFRHGVRWVKWSINLACLVCRVQ